MCDPPWSYPSPSHRGGIAAVGVPPTPLGGMDPNGLETACPLLKLGATPLPLLPPFKSGSHGSHAGQIPSTSIRHSSIPSLSSNTTCKQKTVDYIIQGRFESQPKEHKHTHLINLPLLLSNQVVISQRRSQSVRATHRLPQSSYNSICSTSTPETYF